MQIPKNHVRLARLCGDSYHSDRFPDAVEIGGMGPDCFVLAKETPAIVVFRGTSDLTGFLQDFMARKEEHPWGWVHHGFLDCWKIIRHRVLAVVGLKPVILTGHSLGGAMATLAAPDFAGQVKEVVTFGSPRVGNGAFRDAYAEEFAEQTTRYVYSLDPVPLVPGYLPGYRHVVGPTWFDGVEWRKGISLWTWAKSFWWLWFGGWQGFLGRLQRFHSIETYSEAIENEQET